MPHLRLIPTDSRIAAYLFWLGLEGHEPGEPAWWAALTSTHESTLELGANIGLYTLIGTAHAPPGTRYLAVEPNPASVDALRRNLSLNRIDHVDVVHAAVVGGRATDEVALHFPSGDPYAASAGAFIDGAFTTTRRAIGSVTVPAVEINDLVADVDLMKLDIEGAELEVLRAVRPWIVDTTPTLLVEALDQAAELHRFLADLVCEVGYACVVIADGQPIAASPQLLADGQLQRRVGTRDVTLMTPERLAHVRASWPGP